MRESWRLSLSLLAAAAPLVATAAGSPPDTAAVDAAALYNRGAVVVEDRRSFQLTRGAQKIAWPLRGRLHPDTLWLAGDGIRLTGFDARAADPSAIDPLAARVGEPVRLARDRDETGPQTRRATVVAVHGQTVYVRSRGRIERIASDSPWQISWPAPTFVRKNEALQLDLHADAAGRRVLTATYQIDGPTWRASYTGRFDPDSGQLRLQSMAVIDNSRGVRLDADQAWLVAGDVSRAGGEAPRPLMRVKAADSGVSSVGEAQAAGDTYRYQLAGGLDLPAGAVRSVALMAPVRFQAERQYRFESSAYAGSDSQPLHADVRLTFRNSSGRPLPAGPVHVYDAARPADLMGEDELGDTPENAPVSLTLGRAFDVTRERQVRSDTRTDAGAHRRTIEITVRNTGMHAAPVSLVEDLPRGAQIVSATPRLTAQARADRARWQMDVPSNGRETLRYTVEWLE